MFDYLNSILYKSTKLKVDLFNLNENTDFQPFLVQRWCTMHSTALTFIINETTNRYWSILDSNSMWYASLNSVVPKVSFKKITYIKKPKKDLDNKEKDYIQKIANSLEISSRELINYIQDGYLTLNLQKTND